MICRGFIGAVILASLVAAFPCVGGAQVMLPRAGQSFSFGIIDGPYTFADSVSYLQATTLILTVVSDYSGCGLITSPSGYSQPFTFVPGTPSIINLPLDLIHLNDEGKTEKGLLVHTTEPVNLVLHDYIQYGGDATQILPDGAMDTSYVTCGWGIWNDPSDGENNLNEFLVTALSDSTLVTITPSVRTQLSQAKGVPFTVMLNRGECYIVKSDTTDLPTDPSLSGSIVHATKPVSVISGLTCGYVPVGVQACNELMDELIGRKWWGTHFLAQPLDPNDNGGQLVLTSNTDFTANINGTTVTSAEGRYATQFTGPLEIRTFDNNNNPFPVEAHQLTRSYSDCNGGLGDPSLVTILDTSYYSDTALWNTPSFEFSHCVPIICPTADLDIATLDGTPLDQLGVLSTVINGGEYSAINPPVNAGIHQIISPAPIFAISAGFFQADAYTFIAGTAGSQLPPDSAEHAVQLQTDSAMACSDFYMTATIAPAIQTSEGVNALAITMTYDASTLQLIGVVPLGVLTNASYTIDSSTPGTVTISVLGTPLVSGDSLFQLIFDGLQATAATNVGISGGATTTCGDSEAISGAPFTLVVAPSDELSLLHREAASAYVGQVDSLTLAVNINSNINIDSLWPSITSIQATYSWDSSIAKYNGYLAPSGWTLTSLTSHGNAVNFSIKNTASTAAQPLVLGAALFTSVSTQPATSWVSLPSLVIDAGTQAHSICTTEDEDNHWAVQSFGALSGVAVPVPLMQAEQELSVYPNPAGDELFVQNTSALPISMELFDLIGRSRMTGNVLPSSTAVMDIALLAPGSYVLVCHIGDQTIVRRISKVE